MKLYSHKTDGGAEYLCTSPIEETDQGDLSTAIIRLDGQPELIGKFETIESEHAELLEALNKAEKLIAAANYAFYVKGTSKALMPVMDETKPLLAELRAAIAKATQ